MITPMRIAPLLGKHRRRCGAVKCGVVRCDAVWGGAV